MFVNDATIKMHPHATGEQSFICYCGKYHQWGERGTRTFTIPEGRSSALGWQMILCPCTTWHMKAIPRDDAENFIKGERDADFHQD